MEIKTAVLADTANVSQEGKLNITGIFNRIQSGSFPVTWPSMVLVVRLEAHSSEIGSHKITIQVTDEDGGKLVTVQGNLDISGDNDPEEIRLTVTLFYLSRTQSSPSLVSTASIS